MTPYELPENFPTALSDEELSAALTSLSGVLRQRYGNRVDEWLPELQLALLQVALSEQAHRELARSSRVAFISLAVGGAALIVAIVTLLVS